MYLTRCELPLVYQYTRGKGADVTIIFPYFLLSKLMFYQLAQDVELQDAQQHDGVTRVQAAHVVLDTKVRAWLLQTTQQWRYVMHGFGTCC